MTLACEGGQQFEGHKVVLAAFSPFFKKLLKMKKLPNHPLIFMREIKTEDVTFSAVVRQFVFLSRTFIPSSP